MSKSLKKGPMIYSKHWTVYFKVVGLPKDRDLNGFSWGLRKVTQDFYYI